MLDRSSAINIIARVIRQSFNSSEFAKTELIRFLPKKLSYGQTIKAVLDIMTLEGYVEKTQGKNRGRLREIFKAKVTAACFPSTECFFRYFFYRAGNTFVLHQNHNRKNKGIKQLLKRHKSIRR